jgi:hypothetical protein
VQPKLEETIYVDFVTSSPTTGAASDADSLPTCEIFEDNTDTAILSPTIVKRTGKTGNYRVPVVCSAANGFEAAKSYNIVVSATVGGVAAKAVVQTFQIRTNGPDDLAASILTRATPAQVQTELGTYGALKPTTAGRTLDISTTGEAGLDWANIGGVTTAQNLNATTISTSQAVASVSGAVGSVTGAVGSVTNPVTLTAGERTTLTGVIWNTLTSALTTAGSVGKLLADNLNATISSRAIAGDAMALTSGERTTLTGVIWSTLTSALTTVGSIGKLLVDNINATIGSRSTYAGTDTAGTTTLLSRIASNLTITAGKVDVNDKTGFALTAAYDPAKTAATQTSVDTIDDFVDTEVGAIKTVTDKLDTALEVDGPVWRYTVNALENAPAGGGGGTTDWTAGERDQIRHRLGIDGSAVAPSIGNPSLASEADVTSLATTMNTKLDAIDDYIDTEVAAIKAKTDQLVFVGGDVRATLAGETVTVTIPSADLLAIADAILLRDWSVLAGEPTYSLLNAARVLRNVWDTSNGTLTVKREDGVTTAWTRALTTDPEAQPIVAAT